MKASCFHIKNIALYLKLVYIYRKVHFLHEERLLELLEKVLRGTLASANNSRTFYTQTLMTTFQPEDMFNMAATSSESLNTDRFDVKDDTIANNQLVTSSELVSSLNEELPVLTSSSSQQLKRDFTAFKASSEQAYKMVRTDHTSTKINSFFQPQARVGDEKSADLNKSSSSASDETRDFSVVGAFAKSCSCCVGSVACSNKSSSVETAQVTNRYLPFQETDCQYSSIQSLLHEIKGSSCEYSMNIFKKLVYVGVVNARFSIVQVYIYFFYFTLISVYII